MLLWASTSAKDPNFPDSYCLGRLTAPDTIDTVPEKTLLAFADHGGLYDRLHANYAWAERTISAVADVGIDVDALAERLQRKERERSAPTGRRCSTLSAARRKE
jgi:transaldolase